MGQWIWYETIRHQNFEHYCISKKYFSHFCFGLHELCTAWIIFPITKHLYVSSAGSSYIVEVCYLKACAAFKLTHFMCTPKHLSACVIYKYFNACWGKQTLIANLKIIFWKYSNHIDSLRINESFRVLFIYSFCIKSKNDNQNKTS